MQQKIKFPTFLAKFLAISLGLALTASPNSAFADNATWTGDASGAWSDTANWGNPPAVPGSGQTATFNTGSSNTTIDLGAGVTVGTILFDSASAAAYTIGSGGAGSQTLTIAPAGNAITMSSTVANDQLINANLAYGANAISVNNSSATNTLTIAGNLSGSANFTKTGVGSLSLSGTNSPTGNLVLSAGRLNITAGTTNFGGAFSNLANTAATTAVVNVSSGAALGWTGANGGNFAAAAGSSAVLYNSGTFNISGTTANSAGTYLGNAANSYGYLRTDSGATTTVNGRIWIAQSANAQGATGVLDVRGGTVTVNGTNQNANQTLLINGDNNAHATSTSHAGVNVVDGTLTISKAAAQTNINIGQNEYTSINITGTGKFTAGASGTDSGIGLGVTNSATNIATLSVSNGGTLETAYIYGNNATGTSVLNLDNATIRSLNANPTGIIQGNNIKTYIYSGGVTFDTNGFATIVQNSLLAPSGNGVTEITLGGTLTGYAGAPVVKITGGGGTGAAAVANFDPATGTVTGITITAAGSGYTSAPTITLVGGNGGATGAGAGTATATATISAVTGGGLTKTGAGTLTLTGANTYTGATTISNGTLALGAAGSFDSSSIIDVQSGATLNVTAKTGFTIGAGQTLKGKGTVLGDVTLSGTAAPGSSPGTLSVSGGFTLASTAALDFELQSGDMTVGSDINDLFSVGGNLTLDGTLNITELGGSLAAGSIYRLFNYSGTLTDNTLEISAAFLALHPGSSIDTLTAGQINLLVVPEPSPALMLLGGVGMLCLRRRSCKRRCC